MKKSVAICSQCGSPVEYDDGDEFAYCPMCENDQVEIAKRKDKAKQRPLQNHSIETYYHYNDTKRRNL